MIMRVFLNYRALFRISGLDSEVFLQSQFSNDISKIGANKIQLNAYCQHQGKIIALLWLMRSEDCFLLSFPADLAEKMKSRLQMFILMSDVIIEHITNQNIQIGLINEYHPGAFSINENLSVSYGMSTVEFEAASKSDQEDSGFGASYTMGSLSFGASMNASDNVGGTAGSDDTHKELSVAFAF